MKPPDHGLLVLSKDEVLAQLMQQEAAIIDIVEQAYIEHSKGKTSLPFSSFLRFRGNKSDRIIALPAYIALPDQEIAGIKWVSSFPENINYGIARASASLILNDMKTGRPYCFMEASFINIYRTAASAALAGRLLSRSRHQSMTVIGCGPVNFHILQYMLQTQPSIKNINIFDKSVERAQEFAEKCRHDLNLESKICRSFIEAAEDTTLISFATNASEPWVEESFKFRPDTLVLHISLRDIPPRILMNAYNVVDDRLHVDRENTSIHLTTQGSRHFSQNLHEIGTLAANPTFNPTSVTQPIVYSPFGLGILDITVGKFIYDNAIAVGAGTRMSNFFGQ